MIQRKQTLFLVLAVIASVCCLSMPLATLMPTGMSATSQVFNLWIADGNGSHDFSTWPLFAVLLLSAASGFLSIFLYKNRRRQAAVCVANIFLLLAWYLLFAWLVFSGEQSAASTLVPEIPLALPAVAIVLYFMARQGIMADERLVRSMDRIR